MKTIPLQDKGYIIFVEVPEDASYIKVWRNHLNMRCAISRRKIVFDDTKANYTLLGEVTKGNGISILFSNNGITKDILNDLMISYIIYINNPIGKVPKNKYSQEFKMWDYYEKLTLKKGNKFIVLLKEAI